MHFDFMHVSKNQKTIVSILLVIFNAFHAWHNFCIVTCVKLYVYLCVLYSC